MSAPPKLIRIQEKGQVTLPAEARRRLGLKKGDLVAVVTTADGISLAPREVVAGRVLDRIGDVLRDAGLSLDDLIEDGRAERDDLLREIYGIDDDGPLA